MARIFTQEEINVFFQMEPELAARGLKVLATDDKADVDYNSLMFEKFFERRPDVSVTRQVILNLVEYMKDQLPWKTSLQMDWEQFAKSLSERDQEALERWLNSRGYHTEGDPGFENKLAFAEWMSGREITTANLDYAMGNVQRTTKRTLHPKPNKSQYRGSGRDTSKPVRWMPKEECNTVFMANARRAFRPEDYHFMPREETNRGGAPRQ
jgi:hypothetical protein